MSDHTNVPVAVHEALAALLQPRPMRRGSLSERYMKCNKNGCPCSQDPKARHGPYFSLTRGVGGSTSSRLVSGDQAKVARLQVDAAQQFRPDGSSKTCEVKLVAVWSAEGRDDEGTPVRDAGSVTYSAATRARLATTTTRFPRISHNEWNAKHAGVASIELYAG